MSAHIVLATSTSDPDFTLSDALYADAWRQRGCTVTAAPWDGPAAAFTGVDAVVLRATWGYYRALEAFRFWTEGVAAKSRLFNSIDLVRWNLRRD